MKLVPIDPTDKDASWALLKDFCSDLSDWGLKRLKEGLIDDVRCVLVESDYLCKDHRNLHSNFYSKKFSSRAGSCTRLHFFSADVVSVSNFITPVNQEEFNEAYIGYSVIRPVTERCIGRTVINPLRLKGLKAIAGYCISTPFKVHIFGHHYQAIGYPYTSQDTDATVCAHSALWGICRYLSERFTEYRELYPYDLISLTGKAHGRSVPYRGMTYSDYAEILCHFGAHPVIIRAKDHTTDPRLKWEKFKDICAYVESGFPVLASFSKHVVTLVGHTIDYSVTQAFPNSFGFYESASFLKEFIVVDDNFFPYQLLGYKGSPGNYGKEYLKGPKGEEYSIDSIYAAVCPLPEKAFMPADVASHKASEAISELLKKQNDPNLDGPHVTRILLTSSSSYKRKKIAMAKASGVIDILTSAIATMPLPHFIWILELYKRDEYQSGMCCGEVVLDATAGKTENGYLYLRLGNKVHFHIAGREKIKPVSTDRFKQYTHNLTSLS